MKKKDINVLIMLVILKIIQAIIYIIGKMTPFIPHLLQSTIDNKIPFISDFIYFYYSWYLIIIIIPFIYYKKDKTRFKKYIAAYQVAIIITFLFYFLYPTMIIRPSVPMDGISNQLTNLLYEMDNPALNCLPSMHCLICFLHILNISKCKNMSITLKVTISLWSIVVILSTLLIKQHVIIDVIVGILLAIIIFIVVENIKIKRIENKV